MPSAVLVHGQPGSAEYYDPDSPSSSNAHWFPWLQKQLLISGVAAATPEMPLAYAPDYEVWRREFERYDLGPGTLLVGHSCGGGFLVRWLSQHPEMRVGKVVLVAPWLDLERAETTDFFEFELDPRFPSRTAGVTVFASDNDSPDVLASVSWLRERVEGLRVREFAGHGHFCAGDLGGPAFPELLAEVTA